MCFIDFCAVSFLFLVSVFFFRLLFYLFYACQICFCYSHLFKVQIHSKKNKIINVYSFNSNHMWLWLNHFGNVLYSVLTQDAIFRFIGSFFSIKDLCDMSMTCLFTFYIDGRSSFVHHLHLILSSRSWVSFFPNTHND